QSDIAEKLYALEQNIRILESDERVAKGDKGANPLRSSLVANSSDTSVEDETLKYLKAYFDRIKLDFDPHNWEIIQRWNEKRMTYKNAEYKFMVRDKEIKIQTHSESLSHLMIPKV